MKTLVQFIMNASAAAKAWLLAADAAAQKALLSLTKSDVGLGNVDNTSDASKPVSTAQAAAIAAKIGGSVGSTDNRLVKSSGTGGSTVQSTGITVDASNNVSGVGTLACGAITASGTVSSTPTAIATSGMAFGIVENSVEKFGYRAGAGLTGELVVQALAPHSQTIILRPRSTVSGTSVLLTNNGLTLRNSSDSADATLTAGAITASDAIKTGLKLFSALPAASASTDCIFTVTDRTGRPLAKSDGTNWYNVFTGAILT